MSRLTHADVRVVVAACACALAFVTAPNISSAQSNPASQPAVQSSGPLKMSAPKALILGHENSATISLQGKAATVELFASVGTLSSTVSKNGRLESKYTPPATRFPQVALIAALDEDRHVVDFISIELHGKPTLRIDSEPKARVHVQIGDNTFGPVKLNRRGKGSIQVTVPPGINSASIITADRLGNEKQKPRKLGVPPFQQLLAICPQGGSELMIVATDVRGRALRSASLQLTTSLGTLDAAVEQAPGIYSARFRVDSSIAFADSAQLTVGLPEAGQASTVTCTAKIPREVPTGMKVALGTEQFVAGSGTPVEVSLKLLYPGKRLPRRAVPVLEPDVGTISNLEPVTQTEYRALWTLPNSFGGRSTATLKARLPRAGIDGAASLALAGGPVARISISSSRSHVRADQEDSVLLSIEAADAFGNSAPAEDLQLSAKSGTVGPLSVEGATARARYRGPNRFEAGRDTVAVRTASGQEASLSLLLDPRPRSFLINARAGFTTNFGAVSTMALAADASYRLAPAGHSVAIGVESGYFKHNETRDLGDSDDTVDLELSVAPLLGRLVYELHDSVPLQLYFGASGGVLLTTARIQSEATGLRTEQSSNLVFSGLAGARKRLGPGLLGIEAAYWNSQLDEDGISGNLGGLRITGGYGIEL